MARHSSAKKAHRQNVARALRNKSRKSRMNTFIKRVEEALTLGNLELAQEKFKTAQSEIMRSVNKGILKINTASRKVARLAARFKKSA